MKFSLGVQSPALAYDSVAHMIQAKVLVDSAKLLAVGGDSLRAANG
jgi:hypothetical protein